MTVPEFASVALSFAALIVAILSYIVAWRAYERDRSELRISARFLLKSEKGSTFIVSLVNCGRRPIHVNNIQLRFKSGKILLSKLVEPVVVLDEMGAYEHWFPLHDYRDEIDSPLDFMSAEAYDICGRKYTFPSLSLASMIAGLGLRRLIAKEWTPENDWLSLSSKPKGGG